MLLLKNIIPPFLKPLLKFLLYKSERQKIKRELGIAARQDLLIKKYPPFTKKLIIFLIGGANRQTGKDQISGGIISIVSLCEESEKLKSLHQAEVLMCTFPGEHLLLQHTQFLNSTTVFRFSQLTEYFTEVEEVIIHLPEYATEHFMRTLSAKQKKWLSKIHTIHVNILNQNILLMPGPEIIQQLKHTASKVTISTAHQQYCSSMYRDLYNVPLHKLSVWISPGKYLYKKYGHKSNLMVVSPDGHPDKENIINRVKTIKNLQVRIINDLTYEQYKELVSEAKWVLTFGEGLDGYFIETVFSGGIAFALYNEQFFTKDFEKLFTVYSSVKEMAEKICLDISSLDTEEKYIPYQAEQYGLCKALYDEDEYKKNIEFFYKGNYTFN